MDQAVDYSRNTGAQGAQNAVGGVDMFTYINYTADVLNAVKGTLTGYELEYYMLLLRKPAALDVLTDEQVKTHVAMGRVFFERELYPLTTYLGT